MLYNVEMRPALGGKPPQGGMRVGGLSSVSGCSGGGAPPTGGEGDRRGPLAAEGVGALARVGLGFLHSRERERRALSRCRRLRSDLEGGGVQDRGLVAASGCAAWRRRPGGPRSGLRPGGGGVETRGLEAASVIDAGGVGERRGRHL
jgi:hypothetical protein